MTNTARSQIFQSREDYLSFVKDAYRQIFSYAAKANDELPQQESSHALKIRATTYNRNGTVTHHVPVATPAEALKIGESRGLEKYELSCYFHQNARHFWKLFSMDFKRTSNLISIEDRCLRYVLWAKLPVNDLPIIGDAMRAIAQGRGRVSFSEFLQESPKPVLCTGMGRLPGDLANPPRPIPGRVSYSDYLKKSDPEFV